MKKVAAVTIALGGLAFAGAGAASAHQAEGEAKGNPGVVAGNVIQVPVDVPVNLCNNSVNVVGFLNPTFGNTCVNK
ncbi:chaplin [Streptomyces olivoreticuli]